jgi:hypothetical protein
MKLKPFQKQDLARAALHNGLILSWDTGLGKTWAMFLWPLLKVGHRVQALASREIPQTQDPRPKTRIQPSAPVLIIAPGDLHAQITAEAWSMFRIHVVPLENQDKFQQLCAGRPADAKGRPQIEPEFYLVSYSQLTTNGVAKQPDALDYHDPRALMQMLSIPLGEHVALVEDGDWEKRPEFTSVAQFFAWRGVYWKDEYSRLNCHPSDSFEKVEQRYEAELVAVSRIRDEKLARKEREKIECAFDVLKNVSCNKTAPKLSDLGRAKVDFVIRHCCQEALNRFGKGIGQVREYPIGPAPESGDGVSDLVSGEDSQTQNPRPKTPDPRPETQDTRPKLTVKCVYSPSLSDLSYNAFQCVAIDEGVKMKGEETIVGLGVRAMNPEYRLVLTATPVKNRLPDIFRLAWWAAGGLSHAHARFPYRDDTSEREKFAQTFMVSERNLTREDKAREASMAARGNSNVRRSESEAGGRFKKLTAEVCNVHRLWKFLGPIVLRRRKEDTGEAIVPKIRKVVTCPMGTIQQQVYAYHLAATYLDKEGNEAIGARLQALRSAAADSTSDSLNMKPGEPVAACRCTIGPEKPELPVERTETDGHVLLTVDGKTFKAVKCDDKWAVFTPDTPIGKQDYFAKKDKAVSAVEKLVRAISHPRPDKLDAKQDCPHCKGEGFTLLPYRSGNSYIPKVASTLTLIEEILARKEQVVVFSAFNDPLDVVSRYLTEAGVRHCKLDGRTSQRKRGDLASVFKAGRSGSQKPEAGSPTSDLRPPTSIPVMLAGVECMAEGHSFHRANNVILIAYSWAYDKFIQAMNRVHRMNSEKPVNVYVVICEGTIDRKLESLIGDKGDAAELVLDGRLIGEKTDEVNLATLLRVAKAEFDPTHKTLDEALIHAQWPQLRLKLGNAMRAWDDMPAAKAKIEDGTSKIAKTEDPSSILHPPSSAQLSHALRVKFARHSPESLPILMKKPQPAHEDKTPTQDPRPETPDAIPPQQPDWRIRLRAKAAALMARPTADVVR